MEIPKVGINRSICRKVDCDYHTSDGQCKFCCRKYSPTSCPLPKKCPNKSLHIVTAKPVVICRDMNDCPVAKLVLVYKDEE